jgi:hypothetical protein
MTDTAGRERPVGPMQRRGVLGKYQTADQLKARADVIGMLRASLQNVLDHLADEHQCTDWQEEEALIRALIDPRYLEDRLRAGDPS